MTFINYIHSLHYKMAHHWTSEEDIQLKQFVAEHGAQNWAFIAGLMGYREAKQCRERWLYHLRDGIVKGKLTYKEKQQLDGYVLRFGHSWSEISKHLPGRSPNQIKNDWHSRHRQPRALRPKRNRQLLESDNETAEYELYDSPKKKKQKLEKSDQNEKYYEQDEEYEQYEQDEEYESNESVKQLTMSSFQMGFSQIPVTYIWHYHLKCVQQSEEKVYQICTFEHLIEYANEMYLEEFAQ